MICGRVTDFTLGAGGVRIGPQLMITNTPFDAPSASKNDPTTIYGFGWEKHVSAQNKTTFNGLQMDIRSSCFRAPFWGHYLFHLCVNIDISKNPNIDIAPLPTQQLPS
jgi:hypothetical protein